MDRQQLITNVILEKNTRVYVCYVSASVHHGVLYATNILTIQTVGTVTRR